MAIVQGQFSQLLKPGLAQALFDTFNSEYVWWWEEDISDLATDDGESIYPDNTEAWWVI